MTFLSELAALKRYRDDVHDTLNKMADAVGGCEGGADGLLQKVVELAALRGRLMEPDEILDADGWTPQSIKQFKAMSAVALKEWK